MAPRSSLLYLPPFAEEANRSRRMAVLQARRFAARGHAVLLLDPFGTGDSGGSFDEARWGLWLDDADRAATWLASRWPETPIVPWGLRLGALLAADLAARAPERFRRLLLWQPVLRGDQFVVQFLRLRVAAAMAAGEKESGQALRAQLAAGEMLEVAGYALAPALVDAIETLRLEDPFRSLPGCTVDWLEVTTAAGEPDLAPASRRLVDAWTAAGELRLAARAVAGDPFWTVQEITLAPRLLEATDAALG
jgi:exosortase A-associated hydrolase 2